MALASTDLYFVWFHLSFIQVDAHVAKAIFDTAIAGVLHDKTRLLVLALSTVL